MSQNYNVKLEYWRYFEVEADSEEEAIAKAQSKLMSRDSDYLVAQDYVVDIMSENFNENHSAEEIEE